MQKVIILGAGFAGVRVGLELSKKISKEAEITLVNQSHYHCYIPDLYDVATARLKKIDTDNLSSLKSSVDIHLEDIFKGKNVKIVIDKVLGINLPSKEVKLQNQILKYDYLVVALGSDSSYFGIKGAKEYSHPLKSAEDALVVRNDIASLVQNAKAQNKRTNIVIAGGGFTGVELAGAMGMLLDGLGKIIVIEAGGNVLGGMPDWAKVQAFNKLQALGVEIKLNCPIAQVSQNEVLTTTNEKISYDYLVWTAGVKGIDLPDGIKGVSLGKKNQIPVAEDLSVQNFGEVFVTGDMAQIGNPQKGFVPQAAWAAIAEAETVAENISLKMVGKSTKTFSPSSSEFVVPVGEMFALSNAFGLQIRGIIAWVLKEIIALRYLISIVGFWNALKIWHKEVEVDILDH